MSVRSRLEAMEKRYGRAPCSCERAPVRFVAMMKLADGTEIPFPGNPAAAEPGGPGIETDSEGRCVRCGRPVSTEHVATLPTERPGA